MIHFAHRGLSSIYPENTLLSFEKALELDFDGIEFDVTKLTCGTIVVFHDYNTDRLLNDDYCINDLSYEQLKRIGTKSGEIVPTLEEVLDLIGNKKTINIEIVTNGIYKDVAKIVNKKIKEGLDKTNIIISSFYHNEVKKIKDLVHGIKTAVLMEAVPCNFSRPAIDANADFLNLSYEFITKEIVMDAHNRGLKVFVYTVDKKRDYLKMKRLGVDGFFSNYFSLK